MNGLKTINNKILSVTYDDIKDCTVKELLTPEGWSYVEDNSPYSRDPLCFEYCLRCAINDSDDHDYMHTVTVENIGFFSAVWMYQGLLQSTIDSLSSCEQPRSSTYWPVSLNVKKREFSDSVLNNEARFMGLILEPLSKKASTSNLGLMEELYFCKNIRLQEEIEAIAPDFSDLSKENEDISKKYNDFIENMRTVKQSVGMILSQCQPC